MIQSPSFAARSQLLARLAHPTLGFNAVYASIFSSYSSAPAMSIRWDKSKPINFVEGRVSLDDLLASSAVQLPLVTLFATVSSNTNLQKFQTFAGPVRVGCVFYLSYLQAHVAPSFEAWPDAVETAVYQVVNGAATQNWPMPVVYNGNLGHERRDVVRGAQGWVQPVYFQATFDVVQV